MSSSTPGVLQTMNATPLMDVMLVLLVVFMVITPLIHSGPDLVLPSAVRGEAVPEEQTLTLRLSFRGVLSSESRLWSVEELARFVERNPEITLMLEADRRLPYSEVEMVLAALGESGLRQASLIALRTSSD